MENNTSEGIEVFNLGSWVKFETMGPLSDGFDLSKYNNNNDYKNIGNQNDNRTKAITKNNSNIDYLDSNYDSFDDKNVIWLSTVDFPYGGQIVRFDMQSRYFSIYDLNSYESVPVGLAQDDRGKVWSNDHASSLFVELDPLTGKIKTVCDISCINKKYHYPSLL